MISAPRQGLARRLIVGPARHIAAREPRKLFRLKQFYYARCAPPDDPVALQLAEGASDRLGRGTKIVGNIEAVHGNLQDMPGSVVEIQMLAQVGPEASQPETHVELTQDDQLPLRRLQTVDGLDREVERKLGWRVMRRRSSRKGRRYTVAAVMVSVELT